MKDVYVFFIATQFGTGRAIQLLTRNKYSHVALSFAPDTRVLYSYARYRYHEPLLSGFGIEYTDRYALYRRPADIRVCRCPVTDDHYARILTRLEQYARLQGSTRYNFFDVLAYPFHRHVELELTHTCLSFLLELLEMPDIHTIAALERRLDACVLYEGPLSDFEVAPTSGPIDFYERRPRRQVAAESGRELVRLSASLVRKLVNE